MNDRREERALRKNKKKEGEGVNIQKNIICFYIKTKKKTKDTTRMFTNVLLQTTKEKFPTAELQRNKRCEVCLLPHR